MPRDNALSDVIDPNYEKSSRRNKEHMDDKKKNSPGNSMKDPIRCGLCLSIFMCPRNRDYDDYMEQKNLKCLSSDNPICKVAVRSKTNAKYVERLQAKQSAYHGKTY